MMSKIKEVRSSTTYSNIVCPKDKPTLHIQVFLDNFSLDIAAVH